MQRYGFKLAATLIVLVGTILYANALFGPFVLDDIPAIVDNPDIKKLSNITSDLVYTDQSPYKGYYVGNNPIRPLTFLSFTINYAFCKLNTFGYHLVNIVLHITVALLIFLLSLQLFRLVKYDEKKSFYIALLTALFFISHPVNTEIASYIYHRSESLAAIFFFLSIMVFIKGLQKGFPYIVCSMFLFSFALASKETSAVLPFILLIIDFFFFSEMKIKKLLRRIPIYFLFAAILLTYVYYQRHIYRMGDPFSIWSAYSYLAIQPYIILKYLKLFFWPTNLCFYHLITPLQTLLSIKFILPWSIVFMGMLFIGAAFYYLYRHPEKTNLKLLLFFILYFVITLAPSSSIIPIREAMTERRLYLPGIGFYFCFSFLIIYMLNRFSKLKWGIIFLLSAYLLFLGFLTIKRNTLYSSEVAMWKNVDRMYPNQTSVLNTIGAALAKEKRPTEAISYFEKALSQNPESIRVLNNMGRLYHQLGRYELAENCYNKAIALDPSQSKVFFNFGDLYLSWGKFDKAIETYLNAIKIAPNFVAAYLKLLDVYYMDGKYEKAIKLCHEILKIDESIINVHYMLALMYRKTNQPNKAILAYKKLLEINPKAADARNNLGLLYKEKKDYPKAIALYQKAIKLAPNYALPYLNLANIYILQKQYDKAIPYFEQYLKIKPQDDKIKKLLDKLKKRK